MTYLWIKAFHIIAVVCWFAGLFYLPRLFVYHAMSTDSISQERFTIMERKLYRGIMHPSLVATPRAWSLYVISESSPSSRQDGMHIKLMLLVFLIAYHFSLGAIYKRFAQGSNQKSHVFYRWFNELPVLFLIVIVLLAILKPF